MDEIIINIVPRTDGGERDWNFPIDKEITCLPTLEGDLWLVSNCNENLFTGPGDEAKAFYKDLIQNQGYRKMSQETKELFRWIPGQKKH